MQCRRLFVAMLGVLAIACSAGDSTPSTSGPELGESSGTASSSSSDGPDGTTVGEGSAEGTSTSPGPLDGTSTSADASSSDDGCPLGTAGCSCNAGTCAADLTCLDGVCEATQCDGDVFEPNDSEDEATDLGEINDSDSSGGVVAASLHAPGDVDWYRYHGDDDFTGDVDPARSLVASDGLRLCKFIECDNGLAQTEFECPVGTQYALSPMARPGCCAGDGFALPDLNCTGVVEDNAMVYIRLDQPEAACVTYAASYHY